MLLSRMKRKSTELCNNRYPPHLVISGNFIFLFGITISDTKDLTCKNKKDSPPPVVQLKSNSGLYILYHAYAGYRYKSSVLYYI